MAVALSDGARCVGVAGKGVVEVLNSSGAPMWSWNYGAINRFITPGALAISPGCDKIALAGDSGYKYVWFADRKSHARGVPVVGTPLSLAFDRSGQLVAVGTGASTMFLFTSAGSLKWKVPLQKTGYCLVTGMSFSKDNRFILIRNGCAGVVSLDGAVIWTRWDDGMNAAEDLQTFVAWWEPNHGPGIPILSVLDASGKELWSRYLGVLGGVISPSGDKISARLNVNQNPTERDYYADSASGQEAHLQVLSRDGTLLKNLPEEGTPIAFLPRGGRLVLRIQSAIEGVDLSGRFLFRIPVSVNVCSQILIAEDAGVIVVFRTITEPELRWYQTR